MADENFKANLEKTLTGVVSKVLKGINLPGDTDDDDFLDFPKPSGSLRKARR